MAMTYTVIGPVVKRVTRNINKPPKDPKPQKGDVSAFENAIADLSPLAWYRFREPNFNARVKDSTSNNYHLTKQLAAATRSAVPTRTTHPGGAYFPAVTYDNWASQGTFYKGVAGLLSGATEYTLLISYRMIAAPSGAIGKVFALGTENASESGDNDLVMIRASNNAPVNAHYHKHRTNSPGLVPANYAVTELLEDGVNRLALVRYKRSTPLYSLTTSKPGHEALLEESPAAATSGTGLQAISRALILNARSETNTGSSTTTGMVIDQLAIFSTDIGAVAESDLHSKWTDELGGYYPSMMQFDGSTGYYSLTANPDLSAGWTITGRFKWDGGLVTSAGGFNRVLWQSLGTSSYTKVAVTITNDQTADSRAGTLSLFAQNSAGAAILTVYSNTIVTDGDVYEFFANFNPAAGTCQLIINGVSDINAGATGHTVTSGTLATGSGINHFGARSTPDRYFNGLIGSFGLRGAVLTNWSDFMDGNQPKAIDEKNWTEWGAQPLFWSHTGQMDNNKGSAGDMTKNGTITMTAGGSP